MAPPKNWGPPGTDLQGMLGYPPPGTDLQGMLGFKYYSRDKQRSKYLIDFNEPS